MRPRTYEILMRAIESGIELGWSRAHKHTDTPSPERIKEAIRDAIILEIGEVFIFEENE